MSYEEVARFADTWGLLFLVALFLGVLAYTFWPRNQATFRRAAESPLKESAAPARKNPSKGEQDFVRD